MRTDFNHDRSESDWKNESAAREIAEARQTARDMQDVEARTCCDNPRVFQVCRKPRKRPPIREPSKGTSTNAEPVGAGYAKKISPSSSHGLTGSRNLTPYL